MSVDWTREEHILAFMLYSRLPFGKLHKGNPDIIELAKLLGRTPSSIAMKLSNFARLDPSLQERGIKGLSRGAKGEVEVWNEFRAQPESLVFEGEQLLAARLHQPLEKVAEIETRDLPPEGKEREALVRLRVNQSYFRKRILSAYDFRCCVTGITVRDLLLASHIIPWAKDPANRLNPRNGLCLNALHDRAFDRLLMWLDESQRIRFSKRLHLHDAEQKPKLEWLLSFEGQTLLLHKDFTPDPALLAQHRAECYKREQIM